MTIEIELKIIEKIQAEADSKIRIHLDAIEAEFIARAKERAHLFPLVEELVLWCWSEYAPVVMKVREFVPSTLFLFLDKDSGTLFFKDRGSMAMQLTRDDFNLRRRVLMNADFMNSIETAPCAAV